MDLSGLYCVCDHKLRYWVSDASTARVGFFSTSYGDSWRRCRCGNIDLVPRAGNGAVMVGPSRGIDSRTILSRDSPGKNTWLQCDFIYRRCADLYPRLFSSPSLRDDFGISSQNQRRHWIGLTCDDCVCRHTVIHVTHECLSYRAGDGLRLGPSLYGTKTLDGVCYYLWCCPVHNSRTNVIWRPGAGVLSRLVAS